MSTPSEPVPAKLVIGIFTRDKAVFPSIAETLISEYGQADTISEWIPFDYTTYYEPEMGGPLFRRMMSFERLTGQGDLSAVKLFTNALELNYAESGSRMVNIDPGYLVQSRFVLATGKDFTHRIYIGDGIYADLTLIYKNGAFQTLPWTYPDYADNNMMVYLSGVRKKYIHDLKGL